MCNLYTVFMCCLYVSTFMGETAWMICILCLCVVVCICQLSWGRQHGLFVCCFYVLLLFVYASLHGGYSMDDLYSVCVLLVVYGSLSITGFTRHLCVD